MIGPLCGSLREFWTRWASHSGPGRAEHAKRSWQPGKGGALVWYRHWLEIRGVLLLLVISVLLLAGPRANLFRFDDSENPSTSFGREMLQSPLGDTLDEDALWAAYAERIWTSAFLAGIFLAGNGLRSLGLPGNQAIDYTLTLPIARTKVIWTRFTVAFIGALFAGALTLAAHVANLLFEGRPVPLAPMLESFAFGIPALAAWIAVMGACITFLGKLWVFLGSVLLGLPLFIPVRDAVSASPSRGDVPWAALGAFVVVTGLAVALTLRKGPGKEY
jgi:hypothetical protein